MDPLIELHQQAVMAHPSSQPFWDAASDGIFLIPHCSDCNRYHWYPRKFCPLCHSERIVWKESNGAGTVHTFTRLLRDSKSPIVAYIELDEGPIMLSHVVDEELSTLSIGTRVQVSFHRLESELCVPVFYRSTD